MATPLTTSSASSRRRVTVALVLLAGSVAGVVWLAVPRTTLRPMHADDDAKSRAGTEQGTDVRLLGADGRSEERRRGAEAGSTLTEAARTLLALPRVEVHCTTSEGAGLGGVTVYAVPSAHTADVDPRAVPHALTDREGRATLVVPRDGRYEIRATCVAGDSMPVPVEVRADRSEGVRCPIVDRVASSVRFRVATPLGPGDGAWVEALPGEAPVFEDRTDGVTDRHRLHCPPGGRGDETVWLVPGRRYAVRTTDPRWSAHPSTLSAPADITITDDRPYLLRFDPRVRAASAEMGVWLVARVRVWAIEEPERFLELVCEGEAPELVLREGPGGSEERIDSLALARPNATIRWEGPGLVAGEARCPELQAGEARTMALEIEVADLQRLRDPSGIAVPRRVHLSDAGHLPQDLLLEIGPAGDATLETISVGCLGGGGYDGCCEWVRCRSGEGFGCVSWDGLLASQPVTVGDDVDLPVRVAQCGALRFEGRLGELEAVGSFRLFRDDRTPLYIGAWDEGEAAIQAWDLEPWIEASPSRVIGGLAPGTHRFRLEAGLVHWGWLEVQVVAGRTTILRLPDAMLSAKR